MIPAAAPREAMRADDRAALAAGAAPGEADPPETVAAELRTPLAQFDSADADMVSGLAERGVAVSWVGHYDDLPSRPSPTRIAL